MKHSMTLLVFGAVLPFCGILAEEPAAEGKPAVAHPIEITQGYGSAKWGMSVEDFQKVYPQAKMEQDIPEDVWRNSMATQVFTVEHDSKVLSFTFCRGTLVRVSLRLEEHFAHGYLGNEFLWNQSVCGDINRQFSFVKDSGVTVNTQIRDTSFPGMAPMQSTPPVAVDPIKVRRLVAGPAPAPGSATQPKPTPPPPTYVVTVTMEQRKLQESITAEFKHLTDAAQEKAMQQAISKLAPPM